MALDRPLPFVLAERRRATAEKAARRDLLRGEASHLRIEEGDERARRESSALTRELVQALGERFGTILLVEVWVRREETPQGEDGTEGASGSDGWRPRFRIFSSDRAELAETVEELRSELARVRLLRRPARVEVELGRTRPAPPTPHPLLAPRAAERLGCLTIGLEVEPIHVSPETGEVYPLLLRGLRRRLSRCVRRAAYRFSVVHTPRPPASYMALGKRAVVRRVWEIDQQLAGIDESFDLVLLVTPVNSHQAWRRFSRDGYDRAPRLHYRPLPIDPVLEKRHLFAIPVEKIDDPTLGQLFREKQLEIDRKLTMLLERGNRGFHYSSLQLFGPVGSRLEAEALRILGASPPRARERTDGGWVEAEEFISLAREEIGCYAEACPEFSATVRVDPDFHTGLMVSRGNLILGPRVRFPRARVDALLQHEVGTHVLTYFNGSAQSLRMLRTGLPGYDELQEGLAVLAELLTGGLSRPRLRLLAGRVVAARALVDGASFVEAFRLLHDVHGFARKVAFHICLRIYRGGGLTKDAVYLRGLLDVISALREGTELEPLFMGKISLGYWPLLSELRHRHVLEAPRLLPRYLTRPDVIRRLERLRAGTLTLENLFTASRRP